MTEEGVSEHDRLFEEAATILNGQIQLHGQPEMPAPDGLLTHKLEHAIALLDRVIEINLHNWSAMWLNAKVYERLGNQLEALLWFERAHQVNPTQIDVSREASLCAMDMGTSRQGHLLRPLCRARSAI